MQTCLPRWVLSFPLPEKLFSDSSCHPSPVPRTSRLPWLFLAIAFTFDVILPDLKNIFQIWLTLARYEELDRDLS